MIQDSDYILYKALSEKIIQGLQKPLQAIILKLNVKIAKYEKIKSKFLSSGTYEDVGMNSNTLRPLKNELISLCAVLDRIEQIIKRNESRLAYYKTKLDALGIYNYQVDKKLLQEQISANSGNITEDSLNLNSCGEEGITYKFFAGQIIAFKNGQLDFSLEENEDVLKNANSEFFHELIETFPYCVGTIPDEFFMSTSIKNNILKESVLFVASRMKKQSIAESNKELGGLLANAGELNSIQDYAVALRNYFNVSVKQCMKKNAPKLADEIDKNLRCNEASEFLPMSKRVAVLANGVAGDIPKTDAEMSEEIRKEQEEEAQNNISREELLALLLADDEEELEESIEAQEDARIAEEERKLNEEKEREQETKELEQELENALRKNDVVEE